MELFMYYRVDCKPTLPEPVLNDDGEIPHEENETFFL